MLELPGFSFSSYLSGRLPHCGWLFIA